MLVPVKLRAARPNAALLEKGYAAVSTPDANPVSSQLLQHASPKTQERIWHDALGFLQAELPRQMYETWLRDAEPIRFENDTFVLGVANKYTRDQLEGQYKEAIHRILNMVVGYAVDVEIVVEQEPIDEEGLWQGKDDLQAPVSDPNHEILSTFKWYWAEIVDPERVVAISRYFVKYWLPILGPHFSSTVLAFKQIRYLQKNPTNQPFDVKLSDLLKWHSVSRSSFYRNLEKPHPLLSWFVEEVPSIGPDYEIPEKGKIKQKPNRYLVNGSMPLCPPHQIALEKLLEDLGACSDPIKTMEALDAATKISERELQDLLESSFSTYIENGSVNHPLHDRSALAILRGFIGDDASSLPEGQLEKLADELHYRLVRPDQVVVLTWYFVQEWQKLLKSAAFWLIVYLRSLGYFDKFTNEIRNTFWVNGGYDELSKKVGVQSETISKWFGQNRLSPTNMQAHYMQQFVTVIDQTRGRNPNNGCSLSIELTVHMKDPLTPEGEIRFLELAKRDGYSFEGFNLSNLDLPVKQDSSDSIHPFKWDSSDPDHTVKRDTSNADHPVKQDTRDGDTPAKRDSSHPFKRDTSNSEYPVKWDSLNDSLNTEPRSTESKMTFESTTTSKVNQLILPLIYQPDVADTGKSGGREPDEWDLERILLANNIPPEVSRELMQSDVRGVDFAAWVLYAYSQEGMGIRKPGFFAARRLLEKPPILAQELWHRLAESGKEFVRENILRAMDPIEQDVDQGWGAAMGKVPRGRLQQLVRDLAMIGEIEE